MGQLLHSSARTTAAVRRAIQHSQESLTRLAERYAVTPKTVVKWKKRAQGDDAPMGPTQPRATVLTLEEEALLVAFRKHPLWPIDECLSAWQAALPHLTRSALHRCWQRHGISRPPDMAGEQPTKQKFKSYPIGYCHRDSAEVRTEEGQLSLFVAIDRAGKFAYSELHREANTEDGIDRRLTKTNHPWTHGQVERMSRTRKDAVVKKYHYQTAHHLKAHLQAFLMAYNVAKRLKTLTGHTPYAYICRCWPQEPARFTMNPYHHTLGPNS
jgi:hypothetical protein